MAPFRYTELLLYAGQNQTELVCLRIQVRRLVMLPYRKRFEDNRQTAAGLAMRTGKPGYKSFIITFKHAFGYMHTRNSP